MKHALQTKVRRVQYLSSHFTNMHSDTKHRLALISRALELVRMDPVKKIIPSELCFAY
jgi:hypothetical protein